jgi:biopolymer transport protein TolR
MVGKRRHRRKPVMAEINVTPMVDVMLVLLIIFMVAAPLLTVGVPLDLPQTQAKSLDQDKEPLTVSVTPRARSICRIPRSRSRNWWRSCRR